MTMHDAGELAELRRRAYGPDADIDADPAARQRLRELEAETRRGEAIAPHPSPPAADAEVYAPPSAPPPPPAADSAPPPQAAADLAEPADLDGAPLAPLSAARAASSRRILLIVLAAVAVLLIAAGAFWAGGRDDGPQPDDVLSAGLPEAPDADETQLADAGIFDYYGVDTADIRWQGKVADAVNVWTAENDEGERCLSVTLDSEGEGEGIYRSVYHISCASTLDPIVDIPSDVFASFNISGYTDVQVLRFVSRADGVAVFVDSGS